MSKLIAILFMKEWNPSASINSSAPNIAKINNVVLNSSIQRLR